VSGRVNTIDRLVAARRERVPPGQKLTEKFPVLDLGVKPNFHESHWRFAVEGQIADPIDVGWSNFQQLVPKVAQVSDFHCVTTWTKQDVSWAGFRFADVVKRVQPDESARYVHMHCGDGYTTNLSLEDLLADDVLLAFELDGGRCRLNTVGRCGWLCPSSMHGNQRNFCGVLFFKTLTSPVTGSSVVIIIVAIHGNRNATVSHRP
jgi:DMSO/TMAO reductase YedYZ molybdopterin-dependent catalytic subunit